MKEKIAILHTNDLHSHFENWPKIKRFIINERKRLESDGYTVLTVDLGDAMDRAHPLTEATNGKANVKLMNDIHYDAATIGNNEGLTNTKVQLNHMYDDANFDVLLDNIVDSENGKKPKWSIPQKTVTTNQGTRIMLTGMTAPYTSTYTLQGWTPIDDQKQIPLFLKRNHEKYDVLVLLSHLGVKQDRITAKKYPEFDVIIGSHTHHLFVKGELDNGVLLAAAGKYGHYVGEITLELDDHKVTSKKAKVFKTEDLLKSDADDADINNWELEGENLLASHKVAKIPHDMNSDLLHPSSIVNTALNAMKEKAGTDAAVINSGMFLGNLKAGLVDRNMLHKLLPHSIHVMRTKLLGIDLWRMIQEMEKNRNFLVPYEQKGMGFRGKYFGNLNYSGIRYDAKDGSVYYNGKIVIPNKYYTIALLDHYIFIPFFPTISIMGENDMLYDETLREVFADYLAKKYPIK
ncbi:bifunctional metallophosphatase/5'-nucleotidase [Apilactobacillus xinyiensis]|uniref:bifunctional metallophosphatase/5'-nucleotidase n=1 Tax=Apilactobacillus xinyiensis TaxID=2841032 RepID=UPI001C7D12AB|nr:bifunctional metallophosphatase/5'-nucleotidase [Apilactobacillus xinyiensis]MCL0318764.1 metallophosphoesterase [Apilactobacillus xinyiensis]